METSRVNATLPVTLIRTICRFTLISKTIITGFLRLISLIVKNLPDLQCQQVLKPENRDSLGQQREQPASKDAFHKPQIAITDYIALYVDAKSTQDTGPTTMSIPCF